MPGPGVGDIILQAAQGIVAMHQGQQRLRLQERQLDQQEQARLDAQKAREDGLKLREQNAKLQEEQLQLSRERFDEQTRQFEETQAQQQGQFDARLKVSEFNAMTNFRNMLVNARGKDGKLDEKALEKQLLEFQDLELKVEAKKDIALDKKADRFDTARSEVFETRFLNARQAFINGNQDDPNAVGIFSTLNSPGELRREYDKAIQELTTLEGFSVGGKPHPGLAGAQQRVDMFKGMTDFMNDMKVFAPPSQEEVFAQGATKGWGPNDMHPRLEPREEANAATKVHVDPTSAVQLVDTGVTTGNWDPLIDNSVIEYDGEGRVVMASVEPLFKAIEANVSGEDREKAYQSLTARIQERATLVGPLPPTR